MHFLQNKEYPKEQLYEVPRNSYTYEEQDTFDDDFQYNYNNQSIKKPMMQGIKQTPSYDMEFDKRNIRSNVPMSPHRNQYPQQQTQFQNQQYQYSQQEYNSYNQYPSQQQHPSQQQYSQQRNYGQPYQEQMQYGQQNFNGRASIISGRKKQPTWGKPQAK